jgi:hypothetical protein
VRSVASLPFYLHLRFLTLQWTAGPIESVRQSRMTVTKLRWHRPSPMLTPRHNQCTVGFRGLMHAGCPNSICSLNSPTSFQWNYRRPYRTFPIIPILAASSRILQGEKGDSVPPCVKVVSRPNSRQNTYIGASPLILSIRVGLIRMPLSMCLASPSDERSVDFYVNMI